MNVKAASPSSSDEDEPQAARARVAASAQGMDAVATVKVLPRAVIRIRISPADVDLVEGQTANLSATLLDRSDREIEDRSASWSSSNTKVAQVDDKGRVTAVGKGSAKIRATADGKTGESVVSVAARPVDRVEISPTSTTLRVGQTRSFSATARASDDSRLDGRSVSWSSTNTSVVTINGEGLARAVEAVVGRAGNAVVDHAQVAAAEGADQHASRLTRVW